MSRAHVTIPDPLPSRRGSVSVDALSIDSMRGRATTVRLAPVPATPLRGQAEAAAGRQLWPQPRAILILGAASRAGSEIAPPPARGCFWGGAARGVGSNSTVGAIAVFAAAPARCSSPARTRSIWPCKMCRLYEEVMSFSVRRSRSSATRWSERSWSWLSQRSPTSGTSPREGEFAGCSWGVTGDLRHFRLRGSFVSLLLWQGHSLTYVAE